MGTDTQPRSPVAPPESTSRSGSPGTPATPDTLLDAAQSPRSPRWKWPGRWSRRWWIPAGLAALLLIGWSARQRPPQVTYATARRGPLTLTIAASGKVDGDSSDLGFTGTGKIIALHVREGDAIQQQQLLARIDLGATGMDTGVNDVLQAPYDSYVVEVYRKPGEVVSPGTPVLRVVRRGSNFVTAYLDSEDAAWVKPGDRFTARAGGYLARAWNLKVINVGHEAVPREDVQGSARQVRARLMALDRDFALPLGTAVDIDGEVQIARDVLLVPASAVVRREARTFVWRVVDGQVQQIAVTLGPNNFRDVAIADGLNAGDAVVMEGKTGLKPGTAVEAIAWEEPQA